MKSSKYQPHRVVTVKWHTIHIKNLVHCNHLISVVTIKQTVLWPKDSIKFGVFCCNGEWKPSNYAILNGSRLTCWTRLIFSLHPNSTGMPPFTLYLCAYAIPIPLAQNTLPFSAHTVQILLLSKGSAQVWDQILPDCSMPNESTLHCQLSSGLHDLTPKHPHACC